MPDRPPVRLQETNYSCAPACLAMVLESLGIIRTEEDLRTLCDSTGVLGMEGTLAINVVDAARNLGLHNSRKYSMDFNDLMSELGRGVFPIAYIRTQLSANQSFQTHAVVVVNANESVVEVNDPWRGAYTYSKEKFIDEWQMMFGLTIILEE